MNRTTIEWVRNQDGSLGYTLNVLTGCLKGCGYCYARQGAHGRMRHIYLANALVAPGCDPEDPFAPRLWPERLRQIPLSAAWWDRIGIDSRSDKGIFLCSMGELFGPWLPREWTARVLDAVKDDCTDRFYLLTKQPAQLQQWSPFPENAWVGVSAWDHASFINACHYLQGVEATVKYISLEPLLVWLTGIDVGHFAHTAGVRWVIVGAQTKPTVLPRLEWLVDIVGRCKEAAIAVFLKESLRHMDIPWWPPTPLWWSEKNEGPYRLRQQFPDGKHMTIAGDRAVLRENVAAEVCQLETRE